MTQSYRPPHTPAPAAPRPAARPGADRHQGFEPFSREELLARYRRHRTRPEDPFACLDAPPATQIRRVPEMPSAAAAPQAAAQRRGLSMGQTFAVAAGMALLAGAGAGLLNAKLFPAGDGTEQLAQGPQPLLASAMQPSAVQAAPPTPAQQLTEITKKPVPTATLEVADATGETNSFIPLALRAESAETGSDILLKISGIPEGAYLTSGRKQDDEIWSLTRAELKDLKLVVPETDDARIDLAVAAFELRTGELAAPVKTMTVALNGVVVQPVSAPPPNQSPATRAGTTAQTAPIPTPDSVSLTLASSRDVPAARNLVIEGDTLLKSGDVRQARLSYEKAWSGGSPAGAFGMARSYDPVVLGGLALKNDKPDKAMALAWYERAATAGHARAADAMLRLRLKP